MNAKNVIVVDGANVAYVETSEEGQPQVSNLMAVHRTLEQKGYTPLIIVDASLRHSIDDPERLEQLIDEQVVRQAPAGTDADYFILETADRQDAHIVSNDDFEQYQDQYPWLEHRRVPLMIINGHVELYQRGPSEDRHL